MSLQIPCDFCGSRPVEEFTFGEIPQVPDHVTDPDKHDLHRGFYYHNTEGVQREAWFHVYGCRRWTYVNRNTVEDRVVQRE
jgi:heterotetrameric sarcosine oxidase delta subunit